MFYTITGKLSGVIRLTVEAECKEEAEAAMDNFLCDWFSEATVKDADIEEAYCDIESTVPEEKSLMETLPTGYWEESN